MDNCQIETCDQVVCQKAKVSVPMTIKPFVQAGRIIIKCCSIDCCHLDCCIVDPCCDQPYVCITPSPEIMEEQYTVTAYLDICLRVPIKMGATAEVGQPSICCATSPREDELPKVKAHLSQRQVALISFLNHSRNNDILLGTLEGYLIQGQVSRLEGLMVQLKNGLIIYPDKKRSKFSKKFAKIMISLDKIIFFSRI